jgi:hypothetical protein
MDGTNSHWNQEKSNIGHTSMPVHYEWITHPSDPKHTPFRIL